MLYCIIKNKFNITWFKGKYSNYQVLGKEEVLSFPIFSPHSIDSSNTNYIKPALAPTSTNSRLRELPTPSTTLFFLTLASTPLPTNLPHKASVAPLLPQLLKEPVCPLIHRHHHHGRHFLIYMGGCREVLMELRPSLSLLSAADHELLWSSCRAWHACVEEFCGNQRPPAVWRDLRGWWRRDTSQYQR